MPPPATSSTSSSSPPPVLTDPQDLLLRGIVSVPLDAGVWDDRVTWARRHMMTGGAHQPTAPPPMLMFAADQAEPVYRNLLDDDDDIPLDRIRASLDSVIASQFGVAAEEWRLDDAFAIHYQYEQERTAGAKHVDPSDLTINLCLDATEDCVGSRVLFYGRMPLQWDGSSSKNMLLDASETCLVEQRPGVATIHWGAHPHETTSLERGYRTNIIMTLCFKDKSKSDVASRSCYHV